MNIILFSENENAEILSKKDPRGRHIQTILRSKQGAVLKGGIINGKTGRITIIDETKDSYILSTSFDESPVKQLPVQILIGCPRPPTARRLLKDLTSWGVEKIDILGTDLNEKSYLGSSLWKDNNYMKWVLEGAQQSGSSLLPMINRYYSLKRSLDHLPENSLRFAFDNLRNSGSVSQTDLVPGQKIIIAIGPERGWSEHERELLDQYHFKIHSLGKRILRTETACTAALSVILNRCEII